MHACIFLQTQPRADTLLTYFGMRLRWGIERRLLPGRRCCARCYLADCMIWFPQFDVTGQLKNSDVTSWKSDCLLKSASSLSFFFFFFFTHDTPCHSMFLLFSASSHLCQTSPMTVPSLCLSLLNVSWFNLDELEKEIKVTTSLFLNLPNAWRGLFFFKVCFSKPFVVNCFCLL